LDVLERENRIREYIQRGSTFEKIGFAVRLKDGIKIF